MFPSPTKLTTALHAELAHNAGISLLPLKDAIKQQKKRARDFIQKGMEVQEEYVDSSGATIKRKVMANKWTALRDDVDRWNMEGETGDEVDELEEVKDEVSVASEESGNPDDEPAAEKNKNEELAVTEAISNREDLASETFSLDDGLLQTIISNKAKMLDATEVSLEDSNDEMRRKIKQRAVLDRILAGPTAELSYDETDTLGSIISSLGLIDEL